MLTSSIFSKVGSIWPGPPSYFTPSWLRGDPAQNHINQLNKRQTMNKWECISSVQSFCIASRHGVNYERRFGSALSLKLFGTCELRMRDPTFNEIGTFGNQNRYPKATLSIAHLSNVLQRWARSQQWNCHRTIGTSYWKSFSCTNAHNSIAWKSIICFSVMLSKAT